MSVGNAVPRAQPAAADAAASPVPLLLAALAYAVAVVVLSWPLVTAAGTSVVDPRQLPFAGGVWGRADLDLLIWILAWTAHALATQPLELFQANIFYPAPDTLASSEHLLGLAPLATPLFWSTHNPVLTYNLTVLVVVWLAALCTFALVRGWTGSAAAAFLAGAAFAFGPQITGSWIRLHCSAVHFFPLVLLLAWRAARTPRPATLVALALVTALQLLAGIYVAFELLVLLAAFAPALLVEARRHARNGLAPFGALAAGAAALGVVAPAYLRVRAAGTLPDLDEAIARVAATSPSPRLILAWIVGDVTWPLLALAAIGLLAARRVGLHLRIGLLVAALLGIVISAGTALPLVPGTGLPSAYELLMRIVPGFAGMRSSGRFIVIPLLAVVVLAGIGAARLIELVAERYGRRARGLAAIVTCAAAAVLVATRVPGSGLPLVAVRTGGVAYAAHAWLRDHAEPGPVLDIPVMNSSMDGSAVLATGRAMVGSTLHFMPLFNGYSGYRPANSTLVLTLAQRLPDRAAFAALCALAPPRWIVVHLGLLKGDELSWAAAERELGLEPMARFGHDVVYRADRACSTQAAAGVASAVRPAASRDATFASSPLAPLAAGEARGTIAASIPSTIEAGRFEWLWVDVRNEGSVVLPGMAGTVDGVVELQTRWRSVANDVLVVAGEAIPLGTDLAPGQAVRAQVALQAPRATGDYLVEVGLAQRGAGWLGDAEGGSFLLRRRVSVRPAT